MPQPGGRAGAGGRRSVQAACAGAGAAHSPHSRGSGGAEAGAEPRTCTPLPRASGTPRASLSPTAGPWAVPVPPRPGTLWASSNPCLPTTTSPNTDTGPGTPRWPVGTTSLPAATVSLLASPPCGGTRAPQGVAAGPTAWVLAPAPPHPAASWEPQTEIPPVAAGPAPVTPGTRRSGYTSRTHRQTRHSSVGTGAPAPATAPGTGTTVPRHHWHQHCPGLAAPWVPARRILEGVGQPGSAPKAQRCPGQPYPPVPRTVGWLRSTLGTPTHTPALPAHGGGTPGPSPAPTLRWGPDPQDEPREPQVPQPCPLPGRQGSRSRGAPSRFPTSSREAAGLHHGSRSQQPPVVFSPGCGAQPAPWERRAGNSAAPDSPFWLSDSRQTSAAGCAAGPRHGAARDTAPRAGVGGPSGQAAARHPRTPGFGGTVPPAWAGSRGTGIRPGRAGHWRTWGDQTAPGPQAP